jgi:hypothetical protein
LEYDSFGNHEEDFVDKAPVEVLLGHWAVERSMGRSVRDLLLVVVPMARDASTAQGEHHANPIVEDN